jgi:hypothetical protein
MTHKIKRQQYSGQASRDYISQWDEQGAKKLAYIFLGRILVIGSEVTEQENRHDRLITDSDYRLLTPDPSSFIMWGT